jgi:hypothetical protein
MRRSEGAGRRWYQLAAAALLALFTLVPACKRDEKVAGGSETHFL